MPIEVRNCMFMYYTDGEAVFMDEDTFEQFSIPMARLVWSGPKRELQHGFMYRLSFSDSTIGLEYLSGDKHDLSTAGGEEEHSRRVFELAQAEAKRMRHGAIGPEHILLGLAQVDGFTARIFSKVELRVPLLRLEIATLHPPGNHGKDELTFTPEAKRLIELAFQEAQTMRDDSIGDHHLLLALIAQRGELAGQILARKGVTRERVLAEIDGRI